MSDTRTLIDASAHYLARLAEAAPLKLAIALAATAAGWLATPGLYQAAVWLLIADWMTGTLKANLKHQVSSDAGVRGALKSFIYLALLGCGYLMTAAGPIAAQAGEWVALAILYTEAISNAENAEAIANHFGADVPLLRRVIAVLRMRANQHTAQAGKEDTHAA